MSREAWNIIKQSKRFYINTYRRSGTLLLIFLILNLSLGFAIYFTYFSRPERDFYATNGITPPVRLTPMSSPNNTSVALLASDPADEVEPKVIPE